MKQENNKGMRRWHGMKFGQERQMIQLGLVRHKLVSNKLFITPFYMSHRCEHELHINLLKNREHVLAYELNVLPKNREPWSRFSFSFTLENLHSMNFIFLPGTMSMENNRTPKLHRTKFVQDRNLCLAWAWARQEFVLGMLLDHCTRKTHRQLSIPPG